MDKKEHKTFEDVPSFYIDKVKEIVKKDGLTDGLTDEQVLKYINEVAKRLLEEGWTEPSERTEPSKLASLRFLLPREYREEFIGDLIEMYSILKAERHEVWWINLLLLINFFSVFYHVVFFKLKDWFVKTEVKEIE